MKKILCFGEILLRYSPRMNGEWLQSASMPVYLGGAELNVANNVNVWKLATKYVSSLPDNYLSRDILQHLTRKGIDASAMQTCGSKIGVYILPQGTDLKNAGVIYDRSDSSFSELKKGMIDWTSVLHDVSWLHLTAITPALTYDLFEVCKEAMSAAKQKNITVSLDLNYRSKLWQYGKDPVEIMPELAEYCDVLMGNIWSAEKMLGVNPVLLHDKEKKNYIAHALCTSEQIMKKFPNCKQVANTFRFDKDATGGVEYYATLYEDQQLVVSKQHSMDFVVDKVGSGDCFMAGLIYGNVQNWRPQEKVDFAAAAAFNKLSVEGDSTTSGVEEIKRLY